MAASRPAAFAPPVRVSPVASIGAGVLPATASTAKAKPVTSPAPVQQFALHDQVEYYSESLGQWLSAVVIDVKGPNIMLNIKGVWLGPADIAAKVRRCAAVKSPMGLRVGDQVLYFSPTMGQKMLTTVTAVSPTGDIMVNVKPGVWIGLEEQKQKISFPEGSTHPAAAAVIAAVVPAVPRCQSGHPLIFVGETNDGWLCNAAREEGGCQSCLTDFGQSDGIPRFQCKFPGCNYDLCSACAVARGPTASAVNPATCPKGHTLVNVGVTGSGWLCDMSQCGKCASGLTDFKQTASIIRYKCREGCNFDLCEKCFKEGIPTAADDVGLYCPSMHTMDQDESQAVNWICGASREVGGCAGGITTPVQTPGKFTRYWCQVCDYSLCDLCAAPRLFKSLKTLAVRPKVDFKVKIDIKEPEAGEAPPQLPIGSIVLDPENNLAKLPKEIVHAKHVHKLILKVAADANPLNIWKRIVVKGNTCDVCGKDGQQNYYRCSRPTCKWYCCLECAKTAAAYIIPGLGSPHEGGASTTSSTKRLDEMSNLERDFYRHMQKVVSVDFKGDLGPVSPEFIFDKWDVNKDKQIDRKEMGDVVSFVYKNLGLDVPRDRMVEMIFDSNDMDDDGFIPWSEFPEVYRRLCRRALASFNVMGKEDLMKRSKGEFRAKYELGKRLAAGAGGVTYLATKKGSGTKVVVKRPFDATKVEDFTLLRDKSHPNIVRVFELFRSQTETYIVMEFCAGGDLFGAVEHCCEEFNGISYNFIAGIMRHAMNGVNYLHMEFLECHNDLKPENVLLENKPRHLGDIPRAMIADFGEVSTMNAHGAGDPRYRAPEVWEGPDGRVRGLATAESDIWALGVMFFELLSGGNLPFIKHRNLANWASFVQYQGGVLVQRLMQAMWTPNAQPDYSEIAGAGPYAVDLCKGLMAYDRSKRVKLRKAMEHPYFDILESEVQPLDPKLAEVLKKRGNLSSLKIALLNFVASKMQGESLDYFTDMWQKFDYKREGVLHDKAFVDMLQSKLDISEPKAREIFELADIDSNGAVDFNEFVAVMFDPAGMDSEQLQSHLMGVFTDMADENGQLNFRTFVSIFPESISKGVLQGVFGEMDKDNDGFVVWEEFNTCVQNM